MNIQLKPYLIIVITLILGIVIGVLSQQAVSRRCAPPHHGYGPGKMHKPPFKGRDPGKFILKRLERVVNPTDKQREQFKPIADKYAKLFQEKMRSHHEEFKAIMQSVEKDLEPILTPEQMEKFRKHLKDKRGKWGRHRPKCFHKGPGKRGRFSDSVPGKTK